MRLHSEQRRYSVDDTYVGVTGVIDSADGGKEGSPIDGRIQHFQSMELNELFQ
jgi:hypothetical protein